MSGFGRPWAVAGGWAADAWLGRQTREHGDVDIVVFHDDQRALFEHLAGWSTLGGPDDEPHVPWDGRPVRLPGHIHSRPPGMDGTPGMGHDGFDLEIILNERLGEDWLMSKDPHIARPFAESVGDSPAGVPALMAEIVMFFKATAYEGVEGYPRPRDESDFLVLLPLLAGDRRQWLYESIAARQPSHAWLQTLLT